MPEQPQAGVTHHYVLEDTDGAKVGLLATDNMQSFRRDLIARTALKTASGDTRYSDMEPPYATIMQDDFSGGRGQRNIVDDGTKFYDSHNLDTRIKQQVFLGPDYSFETVANVNMPEHQPGAVSRRRAGYLYITNTSGNSEYALSDRDFYQSFTTPAADICVVSSILVRMRVQAASPVVAKTLSIYADSNGPTGSALGTSASANLPTTAGNVTFTFSTPVSLSASTKYWMKIAGANDAEWNTNPFYVVCSASNPYSGGNVGWQPTEGAFQQDTGSDARFQVNFARVYLAQSFVYSGSGSYAVEHLYLYLKKQGTINPTVNIVVNSGGSPDMSTLADNNAIATIDNADISSDYGWVYVDFTTFNLTKGTTYWIVLYEGTQRSSGSYVSWGLDTAAGYSGGAAKSLYTGGSWTAITGDFYFRINSGQGLNNEVFKVFEYKRQLFAVDAPPEGTDASKIWMNGDAGVADSNSGALTTLVDATKSWTVNEWAGCIVLITAGPGKNEYRTVSSNTSTALTVSEAWHTTHTTATEYVILGSSKWTDVTPSSGDTIDAAVTDVCVANGIIYLACGDSQNILRLCNYNNSGTWTGASADDGTNKATLLMEHKGNIYRGTATNQVSKAPVVAWGTNLTFDTAINIGTSDYAITALSVYDADVWVGKEDSLWKIVNGVGERVPINTEPLSSIANFRNMCWHNAYLFFPFGYGLERLYGLQVDDMGPNRDEGLIEGRQGPISDLLPIPGTLYASIDAGTGTSSILAWNDLGWHELIRGTDSNSIRTMHMQVIPGGPNRLWFGMGNDVCYCVQPARTVNPLKDSTYRFRSSGSVVTSWIDGHMAAVTKWFKDLKVVADNLTTGVTITAEYQLDNSDDADAWVEIGDFDTSPFEELSIGTGITGKRIRFRFTLNSTANTTTPVLLAYTVDYLAKIKPKARWEPRFSGRDYAELMNGQTDPDTRADKISQLDTWAASAEPLWMTTADPAMTGKWVVIDAPIELDKRIEATANGNAIVVDEMKLTILEA